MSGIIFVFPFKVNYEIFPGITEDLIRRDQDITGAGSKEPFKSFISDLLSRCRSPY